MSKDIQSTTNVKTDISRYELRHWKFAVEEAYAQTGLESFRTFENLAKVVSSMVGYRVARTTLYNYWVTGKFPEDIQKALLELLEDYLPEISETCEVA